MMNILCAYPYMTKSYVETLNKHEKKIRFLLDSGAFTAYNAGKEINLDEYCDFIKKPPVKIWKYFTLDVIGDPKATNKNYYKMLDKGLNPIPVFTRGENLNMVEEYYKTSDIVGIGGLVGTPKNRAFVNAIMKIVKKRKVHFLGFTVSDYLKHYKPYMCDSSSWLTAPRYADIHIYLGKGSKVQIRKKDIYNVSTYIQDKIKYLGIKYNDLLKLDNWRGLNSVSRNLGCSSAVLFSQELYKNLNVRYFLATGTKTDILQILKWYNYHKEKNND